ncbi:hypothetical protein HWV62_5300 [Athelia sp. TMB]|nr:hypothetical protein HWV62_5300 [Athelia sp. TMB]
MISALDDESVGVSEVRNQPKISVVGTLLTTRDVEVASPISVIPLAVPAFVPQVIKGMDSSDIGQYGTLRLVKRQDAQSVVASFPIDDESLTFGRDPTCSVRLYYPTVSAVHAKIFFEERKAFLVVLGTNGLLVDGCQVFPATSGSTSKPTTIPLSNNSEIEIHKKRFVFTYPPKNLRKPVPILSTPSRPSVDTPRRNRTLRLSMIQSAEVFTPRPSADPAANLRILQSPLKPRARSRSPEKMTLTERLEAARDGFERGEDEEIVLVDGNHPRVVEEEQDLVILEDVELPVPQPPIPAFPSPPSPVKLQSRPNLKLAPPPPPVTPRRTPSRPTLHKAVLIRSAQRAVMHAEATMYENEDGFEVEHEPMEIVEEEREDVDMEREDDNDEEEVAAAIASSSFSSGNGEDDEEHEHEDEHGDQYEGESEGEEDRGRLAKTPSLWRKSFEKLTWPFRAASRDPEEQHDAADELADVQSSDDDPNENGEDDEAPAPLAAPATPQGPRRLLGKFMTPQPLVTAHQGGGGGRFSMVSASGGPRRVKMEPTWKVRDIVVPLRSEDGEAKGEDQEDLIVMTPRRARLSDEERKAIQERRRSALNAPDNFFGGQAPGLARLSMSPVKNASPYKASPYESQPQQQKEGDAREDLDTRALLERMKETVEGMKRRRSVAPASREGVIFGLEDKPIELDAESEVQVDVDAETESGDELVEEADAANDDEVSEEEEEGSDKENITDHQMASDIEDHPPTAPAPATPHLDLKHIFNGTKPPKTPSFKGMRELFRERDAPATPAFEGLGEMMGTPAGWRAKPADEEHEEVEEPEEEVKPARRIRSKPASSSTTIVKSAAVPVTRRKNPRAAAIKTPITEGRSNFADDEATPGDSLGHIQEDEDDNSNGKPIEKRARSRAASADTDVERAPTKPKAKLVRSGKKAADDIPEEPVEQSKPSRSRVTRGIDMQQVEVAPLRKTRVPAARAATQTSESEACSKPVKRITKASVKSESGSSTSETMPVKATRKPPSRTIKTEAESEPATKTPAVRKGRSTAKSTDDEAQTAAAGPSKRAVRGKATAVVEGPEEDPLDSLNTPEEPVATAPAKRAARSRTVTAEAMIQESQPVKAAMTRKAPVKKVATKATPAKKAMAIPPTASGDSEDDLDKENTPSKEDEESSKPKKATRCKKIVKEEPDVEVEVPKPRATRATRSKQ